MAFKHHGVQSTTTVCILLLSPSTKRLPVGARSFRCSVGPFIWGFPLSTTASMASVRATGYSYRDRWVLLWLIKSVTAAGAAVGRWTSNKDSRQDVCNGTDQVECLNMKQKMVFGSRNIVFDTEVKYQGEFTQQDLENIKFPTEHWERSLRIRTQEPEFSTQAVSEWRNGGLFI